MIKLPRYIVAYAVIFAACYLVMPFLIMAQYKARGYLAFGGEWLTPALIIMALEFLRIATKPTDKKTMKKAGGRNYGK